jgi:thioredoxin-like negative regulator of GroEL
LLTVAIETVAARDLSPRRPARAAHGTRAHEQARAASDGPIIPYRSTLDRGERLLRDGDVTAALGVLRALAAAYPSDAPAQRAWAEAAGAAREWPEAERGTDRWMLLDAGAEPRLYLARVELYAGHRDRAVATLRTLLASYPACDEARAMLRDQGIVPVSLEGITTQAQALPAPALQAP